jgi:DNA-binding MarR family transcriptional regulator
MGSLRPDTPQGPPPSLVFLLAKLGFAAGQSVAASLEPFGLEPRHFALLNHIAMAEGQSQQQLGAALEIPPSRMVAVIDGLQQRGLVQRRAHPSDRRARALFLTARGKTLLGKARVAVGANEESFCASLSPATRERLIALLTPLAAAHKLAGVHPALTTTA